MGLLVDVRLGDHYAVSHSPRLSIRLPSARRAGFGPSSRPPSPAAFAGARRRPLPHGRPRASTPDRR
jgi:hypothetical protein